MGAASSRNQGATISRNWGARSFRNQGADCLGICNPKKKRRDRQLVSEQEHEVPYLIGRRR
ncbi:hypothetical protein GHK80_10670 [Sinorhizobium medicae]|nr:hypothetical protein [Sinorhizobium medicae]MQX76662.1 hypothetical protein [Sinorhizobium medicae]